MTSEGVAIVRNRYVQGEGRQTDATELGKVSI